MTKDEQIKMLKEQRAVLRASNEKFRKEFINKAFDAYCKVCGHYHHTVPTHICRQDCDYYTKFRKAMGAVIKDSLNPVQNAPEAVVKENLTTNPLFEKCLANVNPDTRNEVRGNMDATCRTCKYRERWQADYETRATQYCGKRKSNRTHNGLLKIKVTNKACDLYEKED